MVIEVRQFSALLDLKPFENNVVINESFFYGQIRALKSK